MSQKPRTVKDLLDAYYREESVSDAEDDAGWEQVQAAILRAMVKAGAIHMCYFPPGGGHGDLYTLRHGSLIQHILRDASILTVDPPAVGGPDPQ